jgi:LysR family transcriptional activator of nhaA
VFNLNHLYYFFVVASEGSVSSASRKLRISQPSLSVQIKHFEESVGQRLFARSARGLKRTAAGDLIFQYASQIFELTGELEQMLKRGETERRTVVRVGVSEGIERPFSVRLIRLLLEGRPSASRPCIELSGDAHLALGSKIRERRLDIILTNEVDPELAVLGRYDMPVVMAVASGLANDRIRGLAGDLDAGTSPRAGGDVGLVLPVERLKLRLEIDEFLSTRRLRAPVVMECDLMASVVRGVVDGVGASFIPLPYLNEAVQRGQVWTSDPARPFWRHSLWLMSDPAALDQSWVAELKTAFNRLAGESGGLVGEQEPHRAIG